MFKMNKKLNYWSRKEWLTENRKWNSTTKRNGTRGTPMIFLQTRKCSVGTEGGRSKGVQRDLSNDAEQFTSFHGESRNSWRQKHYEEKGAENCKEDHRNSKRSPRSCWKILGQSVFTFGPVCEWNRRFYTGAWRSSISAQCFAVASCTLTVWCEAMSRAKLCIHVYMWNSRPKVS